MVISGRTWIFRSRSIALQREPAGKEAEVFHRHRLGDLIFLELEQLCITTFRLEDLLSCEMRIYQLQTSSVVAQNYKGAQMQSYLSYFVIISKEW